jgi:hypothetical protein
MIQNNSISNLFDFNIELKKLKFSPRKTFELLMESPQEGGEWQLFQKYIYISRLKIDIKNTSGQLEKGIIEG